MCGIAGFLDTAARGSAGDLASIASDMAGRLGHRGPDDAGVWVDPDVAVALAHQRLSIHDLSEQGHQPMRSACGRYLISFNGEIYNFKQLRLRLEGGRTFRGHSDTEVLLAAVSRWGLPAALSHLNGMFAFAAWDTATRSLWLCRDRMGEKPLYYGWVGSAFLFGSELKALRRHPAFNPDIDRGALALYLRHSYVPGPWTIYDGVRKLPAGTFLVVGSERGRPPASDGPQEYWSLEKAAQDGAADPVASTPEAVDTLHDLLADAVGLRMEADVPLGAFLSGGIDSSAVVALMQAQSSRPVRTFTIGFREESYNEAEHAAAVAAHLGTEHSSLYVTPQETLGVIPRLPSLYDEPFADPSQIPTFLVAQLARRDVKVALSGDGGDELFVGYGRYAQASAMWSTLRRIPRRARTKLAGALRAVPGPAWDPLLTAGARLLPGLASPALARRRAERLADVVDTDGEQEMYRALLSHWANPTAVVPGSSEPPTVTTDAARWAAVDELVHRMTLLDMATYLPDDILVKVDRATMAVGLEARVPLLDHRLVEHSWRVPLPMKVKGGEGKWVLREVLHRYVPRELVNRPKMGFGVPISGWLRGPLRRWGEELLSEAELAEGCLEPSLVRRKWVEHVSGRSDWAGDLWNVLVFQAWLAEQRTLGVSRSPAGRK